MTTTITATKTEARYIAKCKRCGIVEAVSARLAAPAGWGKRYPDRFGFGRSVNCTACGKVTATRIIEGRTSEKACDANCTGASGHKCSCSCGGENHGVDFGGLR